MSAPALAGRPSLRIGGTHYPVLLPTLRDPRLHLAGVIVTLQVLGQVAFDFQLSIAQILVSLAVAGILEVAIALRTQRVLMWPASALLTGNGVAFVLRVPGTEHGDWWSMDGWWIFAGTSAVALLSKYVIRVRGSHIFNPSNFGLVLCFLLLGRERADPLALWWGPLSPALVFALVLIVAGGFLILRRLRLVGVAVGFWLAFAAGIGVLAASGHSMTAAWHVGPIEGAEFWWLLVSSPEILVFLFFMITDPKTIPASASGRRVYAVGVGLLATLLIAPFTTEFATKVAILAALFVVCATRGAIELVGRERLTALPHPRRPAVAGIALAGAIAYAALVVTAGIPARPDDGLAATDGRPQALPEVIVVDSQGVAEIDDCDRAEHRARRHDRPADRGRGARAARLRSRGRRGVRRLAGRALAADPRGDCRGADDRDRAHGAPAAPGRRPGTADRRRVARGNECPAQDPRARAGGRALPHRPLGGRQLVRERAGTCCGRDARRHVADECGVRRGVGLPTRRVSVRDVERHDSDDGRRPLLAGLRLGRLARPLRRERLHPERHARVGGTRRAAAERALPQRGRAVRGREQARGRRSPLARERVRRCRPRPGRPHGPLRDERGLQRPGRRLRRAALERGRRHLHGGRTARRPRRARVACRGRGRGRERGRAAGSVRRRLHGPERPERLVVLRLPDELRRGARPSLSQPGRRQERTTDVSRGWKGGRHRVEAGRARPRRGDARLRRRRAPRPLRRQRRGSQPAVPERPTFRRARVPTRRGREGGGGRRSKRRHGHRRRRLQPRR